jgi:hypothetical protein
VFVDSGVNLTSQPDEWPRDLANVVIRIPDLLARSARSQGTSSNAYLFDSTNRSNVIYLGAIQVVHVNNASETLISTLPEATFDNVTSWGLSYTQEVNAANKNWTVVVTSVQTHSLLTTLFRCSARPSS